MVLMVEANEGKNKMNAHTVGKKIRETINSQSVWMYSMDVPPDTG